MHKGAIYRALCGDPNLFEDKRSEGFTRTALGIRSGEVVYPVGGIILEGVLAFLNPDGIVATWQERTVLKELGTATIGTWDPVNETYPDRAALKRFLDVHGLEMGPWVPISEAARLGYESYGQIHGLYL
jgi:hypothetical protein